MDLWSKRHVTRHQPGRQTSTLRPGGREAGSAGQGGRRVATKGGYCSEIYHEIMVVGQSFCIGEGERRASGRAMTQKMDGK